MRRIALLTLLSLFMTGGLAWAQTPAKEELAAQIEKLGAIRGRVSTKLNDLLKLTNLSANGVSQAGNAVLTQFQQTTTALQKRVAQETAKPADARDQALLDSSNAKLTEVAALWSAQASKDAPAFNQAIGVIQASAGQLSVVVNNLTTIDQSWVRADLDPALLIATLAAADKRIDELTVAATPLIENFKKLCAERERAMQE